MQPQATDLPLRDIHLPTPVSWWPPAPGWWIVLALALLIPLVVIWLKRRPRKIRVQKAAATALQKVLQDYARDGNPTQLLAELSALCRRIALSYCPREQVAGLTGTAWGRALNQLSRTPVLDEHSQQLLTQGAYMACVPTDVAPLIEQLTTWVGGLPAQREDAAC